jgi:hypothetical protein
MRKARAWCLSATLACTLFAFGAAAQDTAAAIALFDRGVAAFAREDFASACPDFAESQRLVPHLTTLFWLAKCEEKAGKIASASAHYHQFLTDVRALPKDKQAKYQGRFQEAEAARASFVEEIPTLALVLPAGAPPGTEVVRDGTTLTRVTLGVAIPVDPGEHVVTTQVPGRPLHEQRFSIERKEAKRVEIEIEPPPPPQPIKEPNPSRPVQVRGEAGGAGLRTGGFVALGLGGVGFITFGVAGAVAMKSMSVIDEVCPKDPCTTGSNAATARDAWNTGTTAANVATAGLVIGLGGLVGGGVMLLSAQRGAASTPEKLALHVGVLEAGPTGASFGVRGVF